MHVTSFPSKAPTPRAGAALALGLVMTLAASAASAQVAGNFQVTSFAVAVSGGTLSWLGGSAYQTLQVEAAEAGGLAGNDLDGSTGSTLSTTALTTSMPHASANVAVTANRLVGGQAQALPSFLSSTSNPHYGTAMAQQSSEFSLSQAGTVTFTLQYTLGVSAVGGDALYSYSQAALDFAVGNYASGIDDRRMVELLSFDQASGAGTQSGTLTFSVLMAGPGDVGYYNLRGNAFASATAAAVPEPSTWLLLAGGVFAIGGVARRRRSGAQEVV